MKAVGLDLSSFVRAAKRSEFVFTALILSLIYVLAFATRLFSVIRFESVIHEFDPYFNYRTTKYLVNEGFYNFHNWFDEGSWYPLGRIIGGTIYPGLMVTAAIIYWTLHFFHFVVDIRNVCVLLAPFMASNTTIATFLLTKEVKNTSAGLVAAALIAVVPGYISRSVAGSYDNEGVAIFALIFCFYLWVKAVNTGSMFWAAMAALGYFYMVAAWGGYIFIINIIPIHVLVLLLSGRYSSRLYVAYSTFYVLATLLHANYVCRVLARAIVGTRGRVRYVWHSATRRRIAVDSLHPVGRTAENHLALLLLHPLLRSRRLAVGAARAGVRLVVDGSILFAARPDVRQGSHPHHCLCV